VQSVKRTGKGRIVAVDGGMGDNPRPALYGARYWAIAADAPDAAPVGTADVVGRYCESGDVLARNVPMPEVQAGDLVCVPMSGAYQLSMASAYNLVPQPAAVLVRDGITTLLVRRATVDDLLSRDAVTSATGV
jgi:diaminopimelate decarboxylase